MPNWEEPDPAELLLLGDDGDWDSLAARYQGVKAFPLRRCLEVARAGGATTAVIETRYVDLDYRSEYSAFYSRTFATTPDSAHRIHFFKAPLKPEQLWRLPSDHGYLGYLVIRPSELGRVGRAMLPPPPGLHDAVRTYVADVSNFFGQDLAVEGVPFVQQDSQLGRCAHSAAWVCHYSAVRRGDVARRPMADFSLSATPGLGYGRPLPSEGLTVLQLLELLRLFGLPATFYHVRNLPPSRLVPWANPDPEPPENEPDQHPGLWDTRLIRICCRYLNSGYPVLVATADHAFVLCGYRRETREGEPDWITFVRHDDQQGPYLQVGDVLNDVDAQTGYHYSPWEALIVPLPEKLWLPPDPAEQAGGLLMQVLARGVSAQVAEASQLTDVIDRRRLALRTFAVPSNRFKLEAEGRLDAALVREYRLARFSRYLWVVEAVDRDLRLAGQPCVLGEVIFDATSSESQPNPLAIHVPGVAWVHSLDGNPRFPIRCSPQPYRSGGVGAP
jgi:hypothetical protein